MGSILTFVVISGLIENAPIENAVFGRQVISAGTSALTIPGLWVLAVTGLVMGLRRYGLKSRFFQIKLLVVALILVNAHFIIVPAVESATQLAIESRGTGELMPEYDNAYMRESVFGAVNVLLTLAAASIAVWRLGAKGA